MTLRIISKNKMGFLSFDKGEPSTAAHIACWKRKRHFPTLGQKWLLCYCHHIVVGAIKTGLPHLPLHLPHLLILYPLATLCPALPHFAKLYHTLPDLLILCPALPAIWVAAAWICDEAWIRAWICAINNSLCCSYHTTTSTSTPFLNWIVFNYC